MWLGSSSEVGSWGGGGGVYLGGRGEGAGRVRQDARTVASYVKLCARLVVPLHVVMQGELSPGGRDRAGKAVALKMKNGTLERVDVGELRRQRARK